MFGWTLQPSGIPRGRAALRLLLRSDPALPQQRNWRAHGILAMGGGSVKLHRSREARVPGILVLARERYLLCSET